MKFNWRNMFEFSKRETLPSEIHSGSEELLAGGNKSTNSDAVGKIKKYITCRIFLTILFGVLFIASLAINLHYIFKPGLFNETVSCKTKNDSVQMCLKCRYFDEVRTLLWKTENAMWRRENVERRDGDVCCAEYSDVLPQLILISLFQRLASQPGNITKTYRPIAHLTLNPKATKDDVPRKLRWNIENNGVGATFLNKVVYDDDKLLVLYPGTYYVYSFVTFRLNRAQEDTFFNHYMYRDNGNQQRKEPEMIFMDKQTRRNGKMAYQTSYLAGILNLDARDRIYTDVSDVSLIYASSVTNYIGLFKL